MVVLIEETDNVEFKESYDLAFEGDDDDDKVVEEEEEEVDDDDDDEDDDDEEEANSNVEGNGDVTLLKCSSGFDGRCNEGELCDFEFNHHERDFVKPCAFL